VYSELLTRTLQVVEIGDSSCSKCSSSKVSGSKSGSYYNYRGYSGFDIKFSRIKDTIVVRIINEYRL
jgi:hypothetical protein